MDEYLKNQYVQKINDRYVYHMRRFAGRNKPLVNKNLAGEIRQDIESRLENTSQITLDFLQAEANSNFMIALLRGLDLEKIYIEGANSQLQRKIQLALNIPPT